MGLHRKKPGGDSRIQMPITPMLDMSFQLLFFFILNYHPSALEGQMELALPTQKATIATNDVKELRVTPDDKPEEEKEPPEPPEVTVIVKANQGVDSDSEGHISDISVRTKDNPTPVAITEEGASEKRLLELLKNHLAKLREDLGNKDDVLMQAERKLKWQYVVKVRDACQKAGFTNAHFSPPPD